MLFISHFGVPDTLIMDNGPDLKSSALQEYLKIHKINIHYITPLHPNSNGPIERFHSTILEHIRILKRENNNLSILDIIPYAINGYNSSIHSVTKLKPFDIISGHLSTRSPFDIDIETEILTNYLEDHKQRTKLMYEKIFEKNYSNKDKTISKHNETRHDPLQYDENTRAYLKSNPRDKTASRYKQIQVQKDLGNTILTDKNITIHKQELKRPKTNTQQIPREQDVVVSTNDITPSTSSKQ